MICCDCTEIKEEKPSTKRNQPRKVKAKNPVTRSSLKKSIIKSETVKTILVAEPEVVEFRNCESYRTYKETVIIRNIDTQLARFKIERRPEQSDFTIFVESVRPGTDKEDIAPGMYAKLVIYFRCDILSEPEETLVLSVQNGKSVTVTLRGRRDPPILKTVAQVFISSSFTRRITQNTAISTSESSSSDASELKLRSGSTGNTESENDSAYVSNGSCHASVDCQKCFVGELVIVSTVLENVGGKGRFFIMSEIDWCLMSIEDVNRKNMLIVPPFSIWPAYFVLQPDEQLHMYIYFSPEGYGLQTDELYIISDNCSVKTIELVGDGVMFESHMLQYDKNVKYQWFETRKNDFCTIRYLDLGTGVCDEVLAAFFTITSTCELELYYRWEINNTILCPAECKNTVGRKNLCSDNLTIEPNSGIFEYNTNASFKVTAILNDLVPGYYRSTLLLIIEDVPQAAISRKYDFPYVESKDKRRLCENPIDIEFENIEIRLKCITIEESYELERISDSKDSLLAKLLMNMVDSSENIFFAPDHIENYSPDSDGSEFNQICRFIKGYGTCDCCQAMMISTAILRPGRPLFVGVESVFNVVICNRSSKQVKYWWSNIVGSDHTKIKIKIEPKFDYVMPESCQIVELRCLPLESGEISLLFIPCQFDGLNPLVLSIECVVKGLCLSFYFPTIFNDMVQIEWNANEFISVLDKKTGQIKLTKPKEKEEKMLHNVVINSSESLKTDSQISSSYSGNEEEATISDITTVIVDDVENEIKVKSVSFDYEESWGEEEEEDDGSQYLKLLPYFDFNADLIKKNFRYLPLVIEFYVTPGQRVTKRIFLQNESPISSHFVIKTKNFWDNQKQNDESDVPDDMDELSSGLEMTVEPTKGEIKAYEMIFFDIIASSNSWGIYTDQITIHSDILPPYSFWIRIINNHLPIFYPICKNSFKRIPKIRFKLFKPHGISGERKLLLENTSCIPLYIHWHCFLLDQDVEPKPFNVILDMLTPFISIEEFLETDTSFYNAVKRYFSCALNPYKSKEQLTEITDFENTNKASSSSDGVFTKESKEDEIKDSSDEKTSQLKSSGCDSTKVVNFDDGLDSSTLTEPSHSRRTSKVRDTEFQLSLVPHYGELINDLFIIKPQELFIPPKEKRYIDVKVNSEKMKVYPEKVLCKACGFIRIAPVFKYRDNVFFRKDGYYLPPTEVYLECELREPKFLLQSNKFQRTFEFYMKDFEQQMTDELKNTKRIVLTNFDEEIIGLSFEVNKPFQIKQTSTQREKFCTKIGSVHPGESVEVVIECTLTKEWAAKATEAYRNKNPLSISFTTNKILLVVFQEGFTQSIELYIEINYPTLKISTNCLCFGDVLDSETKTLTFDVQNLAERSQYFEIKRNGCNSRFTYFPSKSLLTVGEILKVTVSFTPKIPGCFKEIVDIFSEIDGFVSKCFIEGNGRCACAVKGCCFKYSKE